MNITLTGYPLIRLTANRPLDIDGTHICQGEIFFLVASLSVPGTSHLVRWNYERCRWDCNCPDYYNECRHVKQVSAYSASHPYTATHASVPVVVKSAPAIVAAPTVTQVDIEMWIYDHKHTVWMCNGELMGTDVKAVEAVKKLINPPCKGKESKPRWNDLQACWIDPTTKKPAAMLGGVPYWNEQDGFTPHPEGKIWDQYNEEWVAPRPVRSKRKRFDLLDEITQRADHKHAILGEIAEIKERASSEAMIKAPLTRNKAFSIL